ncbi:MAG: glycoside hydrolase family 16 protein [Verrucomicrobiales bacterium]|nr:glycoside hydrolase family 16 protein [Verrucomicrobiales bacterium]
MRTPKRWSIACMAAVLLSGLSADARTLRFGGYDWTIRSGQGGPGPNRWDESNVWLDDAGFLHLKVRHRDGVWTCAEVTLQQRLGFGRYQFQIEGPIDRLDPNVVLGLFNYPTSDVGADATHEIDIEFARWGNPKFPIGNFTVWPVEKTLKPTSSTFEFRLTGIGSTHRFEWTPTQVRYLSLQGWRDDDQERIHSWNYAPSDPAQRISQRPLPLHLNLWLFRGQPPTDQQEVEIVVRSLRFTPTGG